MDLSADYVVVGAGLTGATIARFLADAGKEVLVLERRPQVGGNCHDQVHPFIGFRYHTYGPHSFRTNSKKVWDFVRKYSYFYKYELEVKTLVDGKLENWPVSLSYMVKHFKCNPGFPDYDADWHGEPKNFEDACLRMMPKKVYKKFVRGYNEKQWGAKAHKLSPSLAGRFEVREDDDPRLKKEKYQGLPEDGYTRMIENMLEDIPVVTGFDYLHHRQKISHKLLFYTGPIDEFYDFKFGRLRYRAQRRAHSFYPQKKFVQPSAVINNPDPKVAHIRTIEWKHFLPEYHRQRLINGTFITSETPYTPQSPDCYEYPFPDENNLRLYEKYADTASTIDYTDIIFCGRLGLYKYLDMDKAIESAWAAIESSGI